MHERIQQFVERIDALQLRERALLMCAGIAALFLTIDTLALQPVYTKQKQSEQDISGWDTQLAVLQQRSGLLAGKDDKDPVQSLQQRRAQLQEELAELEGTIHGQLGALLEPRQATQVLEQVLAEERDLVLREAIAISKRLPASGSGENDELLHTGIGRYTLQLQLEGTYMGTLRYLHALEALPWKFFWESVDFEIIEYPVARVTLELYTLGLVEE
ncbi:MAG: hypothetical protein WBN51_03140 [Gammaproteobacteria bacterium]